MVGSEGRTRAATAYGWVLAAGLLLMLGANLPGHMSYDSAAQLFEGRFRVRETWGPAIYAWLLGTFDSVLPGTALYVVASALLLFLSLASIGRLRGRIGWAGVVVLALVLLTPQVLIYQAIVWKDVLFANCAVAGVVLLANAARDWDSRRRWLWLGAAVVLMALGSLVRQNGAVVPLIAAPALGLVAARGSWWRGIAWAAGLLVATVAAALLLMQVSRFPVSPHDKAVQEGVRIVQSYDVASAVSLDRAYRVEELEKADPQAAAVFRARAPLGYSPQRVDFLDRDEVFGAALWTFSGETIRAQWLDLVLHHPGLYLRVRWEDFRWVFLTPVVDRCLPIWTGIDAPPVKLAPLGIDVRQSRADQELANYHTWVLDTPAYSHLTYALLGLALAGVLLLRRRDPPDILIAALLLGGAAFAASFFVISIACDYRYLYFTDLSALVGLVYVAADPPFGRRGAPA